MTTSTWGRSKPRAATSVASRTEGEEGSAIDDEKAFKVLVLAEGVRFPCREYSLVED